MSYILFIGLFCIVEGTVLTSHFFLVYGSEIHCYKEVYVMYFEAGSDYSTSGRGQGKNMNGQLKASLVTLQLWGFLHSLVQAKEAKM